MKLPIQIRSFIPILLMSGCLFAQSATPRILINEFQASNKSTIVDANFNAYSDWIEIFNAEDTTVQLSGLYLTDDLTNPLKWQIPAGISMSHGSYLILWADDQNTGRHSNFKLSKSGEQIGLFTVNGIVIDSLSFPEQIDDYSMGRYPNGSDTLVYFSDPTPNMANTTIPFLGFAPDPIFSLNGGFYSGQQIITLSTDSAFAIHYSLDGSEPMEESPLYSSPIVIDSTRVLRVRSFRTGYRPGSISTKTYFIDESITLPVVSLTTDPRNLWNDTTGIYVVGTNGIPGYCMDTPANWNQDWERPANLEYFPLNGLAGFQADIAIKIGGGCTRKYGQKPLSVYTRGDYGVDKIRYKVFVDKNITEFNNLKLRNGGQDWYRTLFRDGLIQILVKDRMDIDWMAYQPAILFLNGDYWGIHDIREKHNEHYLENNHGVDPDKVDILVGNASAQVGTATDYQEVIAFIDSHDMTLPESYAFVASRIDVNEFMNYIITEIYSANTDWPAGNIKYWREQGEGHKWRWILFDTDLSFGAHGRGQYNTNTLDSLLHSDGTYYALPFWSTKLIRKMMENETFRNEFIQRFATHLSTTFKSSRVTEVIDSLQTMLAPEIPRHKARWPKSMTLGNTTWESLIGIIRTFAMNRPQYMIVFINDVFDLDGTATLTISANDPAAGEILVSSVEIPSQDFRGRFFKNISLRCEAFPNSGYRFVRWYGLSTETTDSINVIMTDSDTLTAIFEIDTEPYTGISINEMMASNQTNITDEFGAHEDWIELYNSRDQSVNIGGLWITDDLNMPEMWQIPATASDSTTIPPHGFLLLWADKEPEQGILHVNIKLSAEGEQIGLAQKTDSGFVFIDSLTFGTQTADISLCRYPDGENNIELSTEPTPRSKNICQSAIGGDKYQIPDRFALKSIYPNPFNTRATIRFDLPEDAFVTLTIFDLRGKEVTNLVRRKMPAGYHSVVFDASGLPSMIYICSLRAGNETQVRKMLLLK